MIAHQWTDPSDGRRFLILHDAREHDGRGTVLAGIEPVEGWYAASGRDHCWLCDGWTRLRDPNGRPCHPGCVERELDRLDALSPPELPPPPRQDVSR